LINRSSTTDQAMAGWATTGQPGHFSPLPCHRVGFPWVQIAHFHVYWRTKQKTRLVFVIFRTPKPLSFFCNLCNLPPPDLEDPRRFRVSAYIEQRPYYLSWNLQWSVVMSRPSSKRQPYESLLKKRNHVQLLWQTAGKARLDFLRVCTLVSGFRFRFFRDVNNKRAIYGPRNLWAPRKRHVDSEI